VWAVAACGPTPAESDADSLGSDSGIASISTSSSTTGADVDSGSGEATGAPQCDALLGQDGTEITMSVHNDRTTPIYLDLLGCGTIVKLRGPDSDMFASWGFPICDMPSCDSLVTGECWVDCRGMCGAGILRVEPGAVVSAQWSGSVWIDVVAPAACAPVDCERGCHQRVPADAGTYTIAAAVWDDCPLMDPARCECEPVDGTCFVPVDHTDPADGIDATPTEHIAAFGYPGEVMPEVTVE